MNDLNTGLRELAERDPVPPAPVEQLMSRGKRARRARAGLSAAALGVVAAIAVGVVGAGGGTPDTSTQVAQPRLVAAATATAQTTFRLVVTDGGPVSTWRREGVYDPVAGKGYLRWTDQGGNTVEQRVIGDELYLIGMIDGKPNQARKLTGGKGFVLGRTAPDNLPLSVDPAELLAALRSLGTVEDLGGGRYSFTDTKNGMSGVVEVGADSGKVTKVTYKLPKDRVLTLEFSDFGTPVAVEHP
jgi:hypothetical protein